MEGGGDAGPVEAADGGTGLCDDLVGGDARMAGIDTGRISGLRPRVDPGPAWHGAPMVDGRVSAKKDVIHQGSGELGPTHG